MFWILIGFVLYLGLQIYQDTRQKERAQRVASVSFHPAQGTGGEVLGPRVDASEASPEPDRRVQAPLPAPSRMPMPMQAPTRETVTRDVPAAASQEQKPQAARPSTGGTIYLCKAYSGGTFWAQAHCNQHQALVDSIVAVPPGMPFEQQVQLAEQRRQAIAQAPYVAPAANAVPVSSNKTACEELDRRVQQLDDMARQPQSAQMQDWIRGERKTARDRQFGLHC
jgi:hypothetical protein